MTKAPQNRAKDASMTLLNEVMHRPLDPGYAAAAERKAKFLSEGRSDQPSMVWRTISIVLAVGLGFTTITAISSLRSRADIADGARQLLREQIIERSTLMEQLEESIRDKSDAASALQNSTLNALTPHEAEVLKSDQIATGSLPVRGSGLVVTLKDGPDVGENHDVNRVRDVDVRAVVSALWGSGAEAIAVNGKRLTATSAIRSAGDAILVDLTGLSNPYVVEAIGDKEALEVAFVRNPVTEDLMELESRYGITTKVSKSDELVLAAGNTRTLIHAAAAND